MDETGTVGALLEQAKESGGMSEALETIKKQIVEILQDVENLKDSRTYMSDRAGEFEIFVREKLSELEAKIYDMDEAENDASDVAQDLPEASTIIDTPAPALKRRIGGLI